MNDGPLSGRPAQGTAPRAGHPTIEVSAGLVFRNRQLLITQRRPGDHLGGLWEFPGGKRERNETFEECLRRELREELGIDVAVGKLFDAIIFDYADKSVDLRFYRCLWQAGEPRPLGCHALAWVTASQLSDYVFPPADERLLKKLKSADDLWE
jgi:8-oxo-dGTP diphosphatase